jgi:hypothetical protein
MDVRKCCGRKSEPMNIKEISYCGSEDSELTS